MDFLLRPQGFLPPGVGLTRDVLVHLQDRECLGWFQRGEPPGHHDQGPRWWRWWRWWPETHPLSVVDSPRKQIDLPVYWHPGIHEVDTSMDSTGIRAFSEEILFTILDTPKSAFISTRNQRFRGLPWLSKKIQWVLNNGPKWWYQHHWNIHRTNHHWNWTWAELRVSNQAILTVVMFSLSWMVHVHRCSQATHSKTAPQCWVKSVGCWCLWWNASLTTGSASIAIISSANSPF